MARDCTALITAGPLPTFETGAELCLAEARIALPPSAADGDAAPYEAQRLTALVSFCTDPAQRAVVRAAKHAFTTARCTLDLLAGPGWDTALTHKLAARAAGSANAVMVMPEDSDVTVETVQRAVDALRACLPPAPGC